MGLTKEAEEVDEVLLKARLDPSDLEVLASFSEGHEDGLGSELTILLQLSTLAPPLLEAALLWAELHLPEPPWLPAPMTKNLNIEYDIRDLRNLSTLPSLISKKNVKINIF